MNTNKATLETFYGKSNLNLTKMLAYRNAMEHNNH